MRIMMKQMLILGVVATCLAACQQESASTSTPESTETATVAPAAQVPEQPAEATEVTDAASIDELFTYASMALFTAKNNGKNKVVLYARQTGKRNPAASFENKRALAESCSSTIYALTAAIDAKDHYTFNHSNNVAEFDLTKYLRPGRPPWV